MAPHVWDDSSRFNFDSSNNFPSDSAGFGDLFLGLYRTRLFGQPVLISSVTIPRVIDTHFIQFRSAGAYML
jgi:hypothetical protein